jgi:hypothetical protein
VIALFQFDSADGPAEDGVEPGVPVVAAAEGVAVRVSSGSGASVGTGSGAGAAGWAGAGGGGGFTGAEGTCEVGSGAGLPGVPGWGWDGSGRQISPQVGEGGEVSAFAGATPGRPTARARTATAAVADMARSTYGDRVMDTFSRARGPLRTGLVSPVVCYRCSGRRATTRRTAKITRFPAAPQPRTPRAQSLFSGGSAICSFRALPRPTM